MTATMKETGETAEEVLCVAVSRKLRHENEDPKLFRKKKKKILFIGHPGHVAYSFERLRYLHDSVSTVDAKRRGS